MADGPRVQSPPGWSECPKVVVAVNPRAGSGPAGRAVDRLIQLIAARGGQPQRTGDIDEATDWAYQAAAARSLRALVAVGGDGTLNRLVNQVPRGTPLAVLPVGTENLLARQLGYRFDPEQLVATLEQRQLRFLDAGQINGRVFLLMASCGFDAEVVRRFHAARQGHIRRWHYAGHICRAMASYEFPQVQVYCDTSAEDGPQARGGAAGAFRAAPNRAEFAGAWSFVSNLPCYGGGFRVSPGAVADDGLLDLAVFRRGGVLAGLAYVAATRLGWQNHLAGVQLRPVRRVTWTSEHPVPYQVDGDPGGWLPATIEVLPGHLAYLVPACSPATNQATMPDCSDTPTDRVSR